MALFQLVIYIIAIILVVIDQNKKKQRRSQNQSQSQMTQSHPAYGNVAKTTTPTFQPSASQPMQSSQLSYEEQQRRQRELKARLKEKVRQKEELARKQSQATEAKAKPQSVNSPGQMSLPVEEESTVEYLREKAERINAEQRKEKLQEKREWQSETRSNVGTRYILGDSIPGGHTVEKCKFCGADNLIPIRSRKNYSCYFCRESL